MSTLLTKRCLMRVGFARQDWRARLDLHQIANGILGLCAAFMLTSVFMGCAARSSRDWNRTPVPGAAAPSVRTEPARAKIYYGTDAHPFPLPLVRGTVMGTPVWMLVDSGTDSHVIAGWLARKLGLPLRKHGDTGTDHVGKPIATYRIEMPQIAVDDWGTLPNSWVLSTEVPEVLERFEIGALLSPQQLASDGRGVVLDLARGELRSAPWAGAHEEVARSGIPIVHSDHRACITEGAIRGLSFILPATVDSQRVALLIDTGAEYTDIFRSSAAGKSLLSKSNGTERPMFSTSGKISSRTLKHTDVKAGLFSVQKDIRLIDGSANSECPRDGVIAMDVLRSCVLLFGNETVYATCLPGANEEHGKGF